jgi:anti-sigma factor RsiW
MGRKTRHPDELFDYLSGAADPDTSSSVEQHLAICSDCSAVAELVRSLKSGSKQVGAGRTTPGESRSKIADTSAEVSESRSEISHYGPHPDISELASVFHGELPRARTRAAAAHIAQCGSCADELAQYARAEEIASQYEARTAERTPAPSAAWELIREWEESSFAKPKQATEVTGTELLDRLASLLSEKDQELRELAGTADRPQLVPVVVVSRSGEFRGVELFEPAAEPGGTSVLRHADKSDRFDSRPVHVLLDFGEKDAVLVSEQITGDTITLERVASARSILRRADYFIVED